jgi:hypothetical protein
MSGTLPAGVSFTPGPNGTATLSGTPAAGTGGTYPLKLTAGNGIAPDATQSLLLVAEAPPSVAINAPSVGASDGSSTSSTVHLPDNHFTVSHVTTRADGTITFQARVPGPGRIDVLETAWNDNLVHTAVMLHAAARRFPSGRAHANATHNGVVHLKVGLNATGRRLVRHHTYRVTLRLWVSYTPAGGVYRSIGFYGLHLPR